MTLTVMHVICPQPPGEVGGSDMHVADLAAHQSKAGMRPIVVQGRSEEYAERLRGKGIEVATTRGMGWVSATRFLAREIRHVNADIVHAHGYDADYWAGSAHLLTTARRRRHAFVVTQHGVVSNTLRLKAKTAADALFTRLADGVIACSEELLPRMRKWCPKGHVAYIPNGVEQPPDMDGSKAREILRERFGTDTSGSLIGYVGRLSPEKRPDRVLTLTARARTAGHDVRALIVGAGPMRDTLEQMATDLGVSDSVTFTGLMNDVEVAYGALDVLVALSATEATPRVVIEAMGAGTPVIASAVGGIPELLDDGRAGLLVPPQDEMAPLRALEELLVSPEDYRGRARERASKQYSIETMGRRVEEFYDRVLTQHIS